MLRRLSRLRPRRLGLRARIRLSFALGAFLLSLLLAGVTYVFTRSALLQQPPGRGDRPGLRERQTGRGRPPLQPGEHRAHAAAPPRLLVAPGVRPRPVVVGHVGVLLREPAPGAARRRDRERHARPHALPAVRPARAGRRHPAHGRRRQLLRDRVGRRGGGHPEQRRVGPRGGHRHHHVAGPGPRQPGRPPRRATARRRGPGRQGHRRRPARHAARTHRGQGPGPAGHRLQRHGRRAGGPRRARRPVRRPT